MFASLQKYYLKMQFTFWQQKSASYQIDLVCMKDEVQYFMEVMKMFS